MMIHVGNDKRQKKSANLLVDALILCIHKKDLTQITISDLQKESGVSRATFYRLFDNIEDLLAYKCRIIAHEIPIQYQEAILKTGESFFSFTLRYWLERHAFLEALFKCHRIDILQQTLLENTDFFQEQCAFLALPKEHLDYALSSAISTLIGILMVWLKTGQKETPEQLIEIFENLNTISPLLFKPVQVNE